VLNFVNDGFDTFNNHLSEFWSGAADAKLIKRIKWIGICGCGRNKI
jgi:hypothetical protein